MADDAWQDVMRGTAEGIRRMFEMGVLTPMQTKRECDRLLNHEKGCPPDAAAVLGALRKRASRRLV